MTQDDKPRALPVPSMIANASDERGGTEERALKSVQRAIADARARETSPTSTAETVEAVERRRLISEVRTMRRYRLNVALEGMITGALYTGGGWALYRLCRWLLDEVRSPPRTPPRSDTSPNSPQPPTPRTP